MENGYATTRMQDVWGLLAVGRWSWPLSRASHLYTQSRSAGLWTSHGYGDATDGGVVFRQITDAIGSSKRRMGV